MGYLEIIPVNFIFKIFLINKLIKYFKKNYIEGSQLDAWIVHGYFSTCAFRVTYKYDVCLHGCFIITINKRIVSLSWYRHIAKPCKFCFLRFSMFLFLIVVSIDLNISNIINSWHHLVHHWCIGVIDSALNIFSHGEYLHQS